MKKIYFALCLMLWVLNPVIAIEDPDSIEYLQKTLNGSQYEPIYLSPENIQTPQFFSKIKI